MAGWLSPTILHYNLFCFQVRVLAERFMVKTGHHLDLII